MTVPRTDRSRPLVVKYGGNAMTDPAVRSAVAAEIRALAEAGSPPLVVHGGGPYIAAELEAGGIASRFVRGLRVTSEAAMPLVERALTSLGKALAAEIGPAVSLTGRDAQTVRGEVFDAELGRVGRVVAVDLGAAGALLDGGYVPVIACVGLDADGEPLNINADEVAAAVAGALGSPVLFLTNVPGVLDDPADARSLLPSLRGADVRRRVADGRIAGGMIPKVEAGLRALDGGARFAVIADGSDPDAARAALRGASEAEGATGGTRILP